MLQCIHHFASDLHPELQPPGLMPAFNIWGNKHIVVGANTETEKDRAASAQTTVRQLPPISFPHSHKFDYLVRRNLIYIVEFVSNCETSFPLILWAVHGVGFSFSTSCSFIFIFLQTNPPSHPVLQCCNHFANISLVSPKVAYALWDIWNTDHQIWENINNIALREIQLARIRGI